MKILFVENHRLFAETVIDQFLRDHEIVLAATIAEARAAIHTEFHVALVDYDLPDGKGTDVVRALRTIGFSGTIVAISSRDEGNAELRAAGANVTCSKKDFRRIADVIAQPLG